MKKEGEAAHTKVRESSRVVCIVGRGQGLSGGSEHTPLGRTQAPEHPHTAALTIH